MAKDPAILWYYTDYLNGTEHMTFEEQGAYMRLLCKQADIGHLSLEFIQRVLGKSFKKIWPKIIEKFTADESGNFFQHRVESEKEKRANYIKRQSENGKKRVKNIELQLSDGSTMAQPEGSIRVENRDSEGYSGDSMKGELPDSLIPEMSGIFLQRFPKYPQDKENDFPALLEISYKIGGTLGIKKDEVTGDKRAIVSKRWGDIVDFARGDDWFSKKDIRFLNKHFQSVIQGFEGSKPKIESQSEVQKQLQIREKQNEKLKAKYATK